MSSIPELKKKKIARDAEIAKAKKAAAEKATKDKAALVKTITAKAETYEKEYETVINLFKML